MESCQFGVQKNRLYNKVSYVRETGVKKVEEFENDQIEILRLRAGFEKIETIFFCTMNISFWDFQPPRPSVVIRWRNTKQNRGKGTHLVITLYVC